VRLRAQQAFEWGIPNLNLPPKQGISGHGLDRVVGVVMKDYEVPEVIGNTF
jgi:hypothetical protein